MYNSKKRNVDGKRIIIGKIFSNRREVKVLNIIANRDKIGVSKFDLYLFKALYLISFKRSKWLEKQIIIITKDLETVKSKKLF